MVSSFVVLSALIGLAVSAPQGDRAEATSTTTQVPILKQINNVNDDGSYTFGFEAADGSFKVETRDARGNVVGRFGYIDTDGVLKTVEYNAGTATGFSATADHIPVAPVAAPVSGVEGLPLTGSVSAEKIAQLKSDIKLKNAAEDFSTDADENGIPDALEGLTSAVNSAAPTPVVRAPAPVAAPVPAAPFRSAAPLVAAPQVPAQFFQQGAPFVPVPTFQQATQNVQADPNTLIQQTPQGFQFAFTAPAQQVSSLQQQQQEQARAFQLQFPQNPAFGAFAPQQFQFVPQQFGQRV